MTDSVVIAASLGGLLFAVRVSTGGRFYPNLILSILYGWLWYAYPIIAILVTIGAAGLFFGWAEMNQREYDEYERAQAYQQAQVDPRLDDSRYIRGAQVTDLNGHEKLVELRGGQVRFVVGADRNGEYWVQPIRPDGTREEHKTYGARNAWRFGRTPTQSLAEFIKRYVAGMDV
jgi:hypothetical protein